uniref:Uncharacterized protein n=1 Tax=Rhizobium leguminosarum TaxID=384 RepID=A0A179BJD0_RHILE|nr:hypothetical protein A4U53_40245 [Rhizobium leguminosarum]
MLAVAGLGGREVAAAGMGVGFDAVWCNPAVGGGGDPAGVAAACAAACGGGNQVCNTGVMEGGGSNTRHPRHKKKGKRGKERKRGGGKEREEGGRKEDQEAIIHEGESWREGMCAVLHSGARERERRGEGAPG